MKITGTVPSFPWIFSTAFGPVPDEFDVGGCYWRRSRERSFDRLRVLRFLIQVEGEYPAFIRRP